MSEDSDHRRVSLAPLTPEEALRALLAVKPGDEPVEPEPDERTEQDDASR